MEDELLSTHADVEPGYPGPDHCAPGAALPSYQVYLATGARARHIHYRMRYAVYCLETGFEAAEHYPEGFERDLYDEHAAHFLVRLGGLYAGGRWVGAMRLIRPDQTPLPTIATGQLFPGAFARARDEPPRVLEVSRLIARGAPERGSPRLLYHLCQAAQAYAQNHGYEFLLFMIRPALARLLQRHHIPIELCGEACEHRGLRLPFRAPTAESGAALSAWRRRLGLGETPVRAPYVEFAGNPPFPYRTKLGYKPCWRRRSYQAPGALEVPCAG
ncbi:acyl-homoserine-lactone synthase [Thioalkalivibrio thiocyanoxidans]|uniref:acyl-homoserine-lactone synthase n=1 Tax=Thioalkalivibrio thiocyanoxidans TaxID=152475 RepID=UPI0004771B35|nr:GNAT family N-acyltransferase [Thioalkalivibrio thiocyanoxidans]